MKERIRLASEAAEKMQGLELENVMIRGDYLATKSKKQIPWLYSLQISLVFYSGRPKHLNE